MISAVAYAQRFHRSTLAVATVLAIAFALLIIPGADDRDSLDDLSNYEHGWPWVWLRRSGPNIKAGDEVPWLTADGWHFLEVPFEFRPGWLFADIALALTVTALAALLFESRRRRGKKFWRFGLREGTLMVFAVAAILAWWHAQERQYLKEQRVVALKMFADGVDAEYRGPKWLEKLTGYRPERCMRIDTVFLDGGAHSLDGLQNELQELSNLRHLCIDGASPNYFPSLVGCRNLKRLQILRSQISEAAMSRLVTAPALEELLIYDSTIDKSGLLKVSTMPTLKKLELLGNADPLTVQKLRKLRPDLRIAWPR